MEDKTDPVCGMKGSIKAHGHYFCSIHCIRKYEKEHNISGPDNNHECAGCAVKGGPWYRERLFLTLWLLSGLLVVHVILSLAGVRILQPFWEGFLEYLAMIWWAIVLGFIIGGLIDYYIPKKYIQRYLSLHRKRSILYAVFFGFLASACSHGILAIAIELYRKGASTPSVIAFLLASPWANLPISILLFGFFGVNALFIIFSALLIAVTTGLAFQLFDRRGLIECSSGNSHGRVREDVKIFSVREDIKKRFRKYSFTGSNIKKDMAGVLKGSWSLAKMVLWWLIIGMIMASFAKGYVPAHIFTAYLGPTIIGLLVTLVFATIIEVCSEGSSPLAFEIFRQTGAFGNSFTFLMAGVATDYTELGLVASNIGKRTALLVPMVTVPQILILGYLFNIFL